MIEIRVGFKRKEIEDNYEEDKKFESSDNLLNNDMIKSLSHAKCLEKQGYEVIIDSIDNLKSVIYKRRIVASNENIN